MYSETIHHAVLEKSFYKNHTWWKSEMNVLTQLQKRDPAFKTMQIKNLNMWNKSADVGGLCI